MHTRNRRILFSLGVTLLVALLAAWIYAGIVARRPLPDTATVYVTRTGECYHRERCPALRFSRRPITKARAKRRYRACLICTP